ncbi:hypothetical protein [Burkholderia puraquae]|nr:hypothetical protein [Burkholderia puraquae]
MFERLAALAFCAAVIAPAAVAAPTDAATGIDPLDRRMTRCLDAPGHASSAARGRCST